MSQLEALANATINDAGASSALKAYAREITKIGDKQSKDLRRLVRHCHKYSGCDGCGEHYMPEDMRQLYRSIINTQ